MSQVYTEGVQTLKEVVKKALQKAKKPRSYHKPFFEMAIDVYRQLRLHNVLEGKTWAKLTPGSLKTADFPPDFENFLGLYVPVNGELFPLTRKDSIITTTSLDGVIEVLDSEVGEGVDVSSPVGDGFYVKGGVNMQGYYAMDWGRRRIHFRNLSVDEVILFYVSSGSMTTSQTWVPNKYIPALIAGIVYEYYMYDDRYPQPRRQELLQQYNTEIIKLADLEGPSLEEYMDAVRSTYYATPKRY